MEKVRYGLVGFGAWGQHHADAIAKAPNAELIGIAAASEKTAEAARSAYPDAFVTTDFHQLIGRDDIEVVDVVVPSHLHHDVTTAVLGSGKHCLLEKPMGINLQECNDMIEASQAANKLLCVGHELRLSSMWGKAKELVDEGFIGKPQYCLVELSRNPYRLGSDGWRYDINRVGNWILEEPIHFFDLARWYLESAGNPTTIYATANSRDESRPELQDNFSAIMHFDGKAYAVVSQTLSAFEHHQTIKITGSRGALWASWSGAMDRTRHPSYRLRAFDGEQITDIPIEKPTGELFELEDQIIRVADAVRDGKPLHCTAEDGCWSVAMCLAATESVQSGRPHPIVTRA
ncbi:Gfo/Idh/MocA family oxidoreductase [Stieleria sp. JC731]|uniref:Gfo/Idh/MocA family protein n=1 Tax=Pirellulaceae TaxID=2691357 RepID=UPI001E5E9E94|nr:Gfo/Idh/MocA family oxidoreductase [Stieleria sp. JC731]MCC9603629.1 Gfo/Idh/MocA family oxidoreductase [Stieleria sp. JC731]